MLPTRSIEGKLLAGIYGVQILNFLLQSSLWVKQTCTFTGTVNRFCNVIGGWRWTTEKTPDGSEIHQFTIRLGELDYLPHLLSLTTASHRSWFSSDWQWTSWRWSFVLSFLTPIDNQFTPVDDVTLKQYFFREWDTPNPWCLKKKMVVEWKTFAWTWRDPPALSSPIGSILWFRIWRIHFVLETIASWSKPQHRRQDAIRFWRETSEWTAFYLPAPRIAALPASASNLSINGAHQPWRLPSRYRWMRLFAVWCCWWSLCAWFRWFLV